MRIFFCVILATTILRSDASLTIIAPPFIGKKVILQAYLFKGERKKKVALWTLPPNTRFSMSFFHSVTLSPIVSTYVVHDRNIVQVQEQFTALGYGLASGNNDIGIEKWEERDGMFTIHMKRAVRPLIIRISQKYKTALTIGTESYSLQRYDGKSLLFKTAEL